MNYPEILKGRVATYKCSGTIYSKGVYHLRWVWIDTTWSSLEAESDWFGFETLEECIEDHRVHVEKLHAMRHGGTISQLLPLPEGEVADEARYLARELRDQADDLSPSLELFGLMHSAADLLEQRQAAPPAAEEVGYAKDVRRMCDIILGNTFGNEELDSLALLVGHHPDVLNASPVPAPAPAEGEVAELVAWIRGMYWAHPDKERATRAADLLEQHHHAPVPVRERLPGPEDCDAEGRCWWGKPYGYRGRNIEEPYWVFGDSDCYRFMACTLWLPATALPLLTTEV